MDGIPYDGMEEAHVKLIKYAGESFFKLDVLLYDIPLTDQGMDIVAVFEVNEINNNGTFYTDSNGLEMLERELNVRPTFDLVTNQTIASNFYPVNSAIAIRDKINGNGL